MQSSPTLRARNRDATFQLILEAVGQCLRDTSLTDLTFAQVARASGVGERTVYRYFPTKDHLLDGWWRLHKESLGQESFPSTASELAAFPLKAFPKFDADAEVMRGAVLSPQGRAMTLARNAERTLAIRQAVRSEVGELSEEDETALCAALQLLQSATAWLTMRDYWGLTGPQSGAASSRAIQALFKLAREGEYPEIKS